MPMLAPAAPVHRRATPTRGSAHPVSKLPLHAYQSFDGGLQLGEIGVRWRRGDAPAVIEERGVWIGLLDPLDLLARLEAGQHRRAARDVLSPDLDYCFHDTDAAEAAEFASARGAAWVGVLDDEGRLLGLVARADLARVGSASGTRRERGGPGFGHAA